MSNKYLRQLLAITKKHYKKLIKLILAMAMIVIMYSLSIAIHESPEMHMIQNWNTMRDFAEFHKNYEGEKTKEDFMSSLSR